MYFKNKLEKISSPSSNQHCFMVNVNNAMKQPPRGEGWKHKNAFWMIHFYG